MARKSRRDSKCEIQDSFVPNKSDESRIATAIYARLSLENNGREDEESITSQLTLLRSYIRENPQFELIDTYVDNGYTGTNFNRPEFNRLITDLNCGKISCVVVKDLSRFGRNYIETGMYVETIFPKLGVRLIAINDHFDSFSEESRDSISVPMKNMINEMYSRDQSRKGIIANRLKSHKDNVLPNGTPPFGYLRNKTRTQYVVDPQKADYVRLIFIWRGLGVTNQQICHRLNLIGAPLPSEGIDCRKCGWWTPQSTVNITKNRAYLGNTYFGRRTSRITANGRVTKFQSEDRWVVHENTHEPIVTQYDFDFANAACKHRSKGVNDYFNAPITNLKTIVFCKECDKKMIYVDSGYSKLSKKRFARFSCGKEARNTKFCNNFVSEDLVKVVVMDSLKIQLKIMTDKANLIRSAKMSGNGKDIALSIDKKIAFAETSLEEEKGKQAKLYEDYRSGLVDRDDYDLISENHSSRVRFLEEKHNELLKRRDEYVRAINSYLAMIDEMDSTPDDDGYDDKLVGKLVERVYVTADKRVEIIFKSFDLIKLVDEALKGGKK